MAVKSFDDALREQFADAVARRDAITAAAKPAREAYEAKRREIMRIEQEELAPLTEALRQAEEGLYDLQNEIAAIARALKGKTGSN